MKTRQKQLAPALALVLALDPALEPAQAWAPGTIQVNLFQGASYFDDGAMVFAAATLQSSLDLWHGMLAVKGQNRFWSTHTVSDRFNSGVNVSQTSVGVDLQVMALPANAVQEERRPGTCSTRVQQHPALDQVALVQHPSWTLALAVGQGQGPEQELA